VPTVNLGDALAIFWERACFFLLEGLSDAIAFHAAVLRNPSIDLYWQNLLADAFGGSRLALYIVTYFLGGIYDEC
jgi:hypothetical protein